MGWIKNRVVSNKEEVYMELVGEYRLIDPRDPKREWNIVIDEKGKVTSMEDIVCRKCGGNRVYLLSDSCNYWCPDCQQFADRQDG